jgi:hypothetical protein
MVPSRQDKSWPEEQQLQLTQGKVYCLICFIVPHFICLDTYVDAEDHRASSSMETYWVCWWGLFQCLVKQGMQPENFMATT